MKDFSEQLKKVMELRGISQTELCEKTGIPKSAMSQYLSGAFKPKQARTYILAEALHTTPEYLMGTLDNPDPAPELKSPLHIIRYTPDQMTPIPVVGKVAAGYTCLAEQYIEGYALADPDSLTDGYDYFWLRVTGDSMEPDIREGDLVLVRVQEAVESGECAVVLVDEEDGLVKDVEIGKDHVTLCSKNPNYPPRVFVREEANRVRIVGKVVELKRVI